MKKLLLMIIFFPICAFADEDVTVIYERVILDKECVAIGAYGDIAEAEELLIETTNIKDGSYKVEVTRIGDHIYKIDGTSFYIKMPYCYEYSYSEDAILKVETFYGKKMGKLIWVED